MIGWWMWTGITLLPEDLAGGGSDRRDRSAPSKRVKFFEKRTLAFSTRAEAATMPIGNIPPMAQVISTSVASQQFILLLMGVFAGIALILTAVGIYGVLSYQVSQRTNEIGIRMALGAGARDVLKLVVGQGLRLTLMGVAMGLAAALGLTRLISHLLFGVSATDPMVFISIALVLTGVAALACYLPARRATKVDPIVALRYE